MAQLNTYVNTLGQVVPLPTAPDSQWDPNAIARITPKADREAVKLAYATWLAGVKEGTETNPFSYPGLTYTP